ncbi:MAG: Transglycosylase associated protein [Candidatus Jettenia ecosi]|uniref:Transglycosylase associated protein n=1 Tax=Candidatus Jettenia ecosi TaxID=2494326 RepID=A0A533QB76_9BACT|nr:MAG: Transglycosylase associated protein [Candidatus Jettenia ecosi]
MYLIIWIISGIVAGWLTGLIIRGRGFGLMGDLIIGILGGILGGWLFAVFGLLVIGIMGNIIAAVIGGIVLVAIIRILRRA